MAEGFFGKIRNEIFNSDIGIDLGTARVLVYGKGRGLLFDEPSMVVVDKESGQVLRIGDEASKYLGRASEKIEVVRPLSEGVINRYSVTMQMVQYFIKKASGNTLVKPRVLVCVPSCATEVDQLAALQAAKQAGARHALLVEEPLAAAIGAGINISEPKGKMVIDIGGGTTDIAVISLDGIVEKESLKIAGDQFDYAIMRYVQKKYGLLISRSAAEQIKMRIGTLSQSKDSKRMEVKGRSVKTSHPESVIVSSNEILDAVNETVSAILLAVSRVLRSTPPELVSDIMLNGIVMTGGGSLLQGLDKMVERFTGIPTTVAPDAPKCVINGMGKLLDNLSDNLDGSSDLIRDEIKFV